MPLISLDNITVDYGTGPVLEDVCFSLESNNHIGLVGANGEGKTTFLSVLAGELVPHEGIVHRQRGLKIGFLHQEDRLTGEDSLILTVMENHPEIPELERKIHSLIKDNLTSKELEEYHKLESRLLQLDGYTFKSRAEGILSALGFKENQFETPVNKLSGGEKNRAAIACLLLAEPDIILMDEPTNHIDYDGLVWLIDFLKKCNKPYIVISHNRFFLDQISDTILEIRGASTTSFAGNYSYYEKKREEIDRRILKQYEAQREEIKRIEDFIQKNIAGQKTKQAQARRKTLANLERIIPPDQKQNINIRFKDIRRSGNIILQAENISAAFSTKKLFDNFDITLHRKDHIGIVGPNGCGKTTLLSILAGKQRPNSGKVKTGSRVFKGYYSQDFSDIDSSNSAFQEIRNFDGSMTDENIHSALALFSFRSDQIFRPLSTFSGGEIARVALLKLLLGKANFLLLDEPTNHLDIDSSKTLENALVEFEGTVLVISHDRYFLRKVADKILAFEEDGIKMFEGGFEYYLERRKSRLSERKDSPKIRTNPRTNYKRKGSPPKKKLNLYQIKKNHGELEKEISTLEKEQEKVAGLLSEDYVASDWARMSSLIKEYETITDNLEKKMAEWEKLEQVLQENSE